MYVRITKAMLGVSIKRLARLVFYLSLITGFLYAIHVSSYINYYYHVEPLRQRKYNFIIEFDINTSSLRGIENPGLPREIVADIVGLAENISDSGMYLIMDLADKDLVVSYHSPGNTITLHGATFMYAGRPDAVTLFYPVKKEYLGGKWGSILIHAKDMLSKPAPWDSAHTAIVTSESYTFTAILEEKIDAGEDYMLFAWNREYLGMLKLPLTIYVKTHLNRGELDVMLSRFLSQHGLREILPGYTIRSKDEIVERNRENVLGGTNTYWMRTTTLLSIIAVAFISFKSGVESAESSRDLLGVLRLYGAGYSLLVFSSIIIGVLSSLAVLLAAILFPYAYYAWFLGISYPPITYMTTHAWIFLALIPAAFAPSHVLATLYYTHRKSLEELVVGG